MKPINFDSCPIFSITYGGNKTVDQCMAEVNNILERDRLRKKAEEAKADYERKLMEPSVIKLYGGIFYDP